MRRICWSRRSAPRTRVTTLEERALFANTAVDRIVPVQAEGAGLDVTVEDFYEVGGGARAPSRGMSPISRGITWVDALGPYIERKLFTVNTGHATTAWHGWAAGHATIADSITNRRWSRARSRRCSRRPLRCWWPSTASPRRRWPPPHQGAGAFRENTALPDPVERVGRSPLRKLSREDRIIGPAAVLAERNMGHDALLSSLSAALVFTPEGDEEVERLQQILRSSSDAGIATTEITGLEPAHPLFPEVRARIAGVYSGHTE